MVTYTLNNVNYTYTVGTVVASVGSSASATDDISLLSSFEVDGDTYNVTSIAASAFYGATNLTSVTIPTSVTVINESAFEGCTNLTTVNIPSVTTIGVNAFYGCSSLTSVTIPSTVTNILGNPFRNCVNLSSITVDANNTVFLSENGVLFDKLKQNLILYPSKLLNTSYVIPSTVESINSYAFNNCENLITVMIPSLMSLNDSTFSNCSNLLNVIFTGIVPTINGNNFEATLDTAVYDSAKNPNNVLNRLSMFTNTLNQPTPTLTNFTLPSYTFSSVPFVITPPTSDVSGGVITYTSSNSAISTVSGNMLTLVTVDNGTSYITATQTFTNFYGDLSFTTFTSVNSNALYIYQATPSLSFSVPAKTFGDGSFNLVAPTSNSDGAFTYTSSDTAVATISGSTVTIIGLGSSTITAVQASTANFSTESITATLTVLSAPTITDFSVPEKTFGDVSFNLVAPTSNSDGLFTYTSSNTAVATISGSTVTIVGAGTATITAVQTSDTEIYGVGSITTTLTVNQATPVLIDFSVPSQTFEDVSFNLVAPTSNSDGAFTYTSSNTTVATIDDITVTIIGVGTSTITAVQESTTNFLTESITAPLTVNQATPVLTDFSVPAKIVGDASFNLVDPTSNSDGAFTYTSSDTTVATISGSTVTIIGVGTSTITAVQESTTNYLSESITAPLVVNQALPDLNNFSVPEKTFGDVSFNLVAPTSNSDGLFTYTSSDTTVATIDGNTVTIVGGGSSTITAVQASTAIFLTESITTTLVVNPATPDLIDFSVPEKTFGDVSFNLVAPTSNSDGLFTYTSSNTAVATISGSTVTIVGGGSSTITAGQASTANYLSESITTTLTVSQATPVLTDFSVPEKTFGDVSFNLVAPTSNSDGLFTYTSSNTAVATISGSRVTIVGVGTSTITAVQASTANFLTESITAPLVVSQATPTITDFSVPSKTFGDASFNIVAPTTNSSGAFTYTSSDTTVATISGSKITIVGAGTATITASQASTANYTSGTIPATLTVNLATTVLSNFYVPAKSISTTPFTLSPPTTNANGTFTYTSSDPTVATIDGSMVTIIGLGTTAITVVQSSTVNFMSASITEPLTIMNQVPISIGVGSGGNTIASSTDLGLRWTGRGATTFTTAGYGVAGPATYADPSLNGKLMISSTSIFTNGFYKTSFTKPSVLFADVHKIKYANGIWVVISSSPASSGNNLAISSDGITWTGKRVGSAYALSDIVYGNNTWATITTGNDARSSMIYYSTNNWSSFTEADGITRSTFISYANGLWFMNYDTRIFSSSGSNISGFNNRNNGTIFTTGFFKVAGGKDGIGGNLWIAVGSGGNTIAKSSDGFAWSGFTNSFFTAAAYDVAYANGLWIVCGSTASNYVLATSSDGTIFTTVLTTASISLLRIVWTGSEWFVGGSGFITSTNGTNWNTCSTGISATSFDVGPSQIFTKPTFIAVGQGGNTMATSNNGTTWKGEGSDIFTTAGYGVAWNGTQWVAVGSGRNNIAYSSDGILWTGNSTQTFSTQGNDVAYGKDISGNGLWVVAGQGVNSIATSSDGLTWTGRGTTVFTTAGWCVAFGKDGSGNRLLVAVGQGTNTIATSTNGITWTGRGATIFTTKGIGVTYANNLWIAVGQGGNSIATSVNGINWTGLGPTIFTQGNGIRYTNNMWVATGTGANTIATSTNGTTWTGRGATIFTTAGQDVLGPTSVEPMMTFTVPPRYIEEAPFTITPPTSNSSGLFTYTSSNASVATVDGTTVTIVGPGTSTISAFQESTDYYISGTIDVSFTVNKLVTVLTDFSVPEKSIGDEAFTIIPPTSNSDAEATFIYTSSDTTVATIVGTTITIVGAGTTTITAFQASSARYASGTTTATFIVNKLITVLTDFSVPAKTFGDVSFNLIAPTTNGNGAITYTSSNTAVATISGSRVTIVGGGTSTITAVQASTPIYASGTTTATLLVNQATTVLSNFSVPTKTFGNAAFNLVAPTTNRNGAITYTSSDTTVATVSGTTITIVGGGTATITANQASTANYLAGTISTTLTVNQATPTITNFVVPAKVIGDASFNLVNPTSNSSGLFTYTSSNTDVATIEGNVVTIITNGIVTITASQASTTNYISRSLTGTLYVRLIPTITNFVIPAKTFGEVSYFYFPSPVSDSSGFYTFTSSNTSVATIYSNAVNEVNELTIRACGTTTITAVQAMTDQYISGTITTTFTVNQATTVLSNFSVASRTYGDYSNGNGMNFSAIPPTTNNNQGAFTYTSSNTSVATINQYIITIVGGGTTTITAVQASASNYTTASISAPFTVTPATGVLSNFSVPDKVVGDASFSITTPASAKNYWALANTGAFTYTSSNIAVATIQGNVITVVGNGTSTITAFQAATTNYTSASITNTFRVRLIPTLSNFVIPAKIFGNADFTVTPPTTESDGGFTYASSNSAVAYFYSGNVIKIVTTGTITVTATLYASNDYTSKTITTTFTVNPATPVLSNFSNLTKYVGASFYITQPISNSTGAWTYTSSDTSVASISIIYGSSYVTISQVGSTTITAFQAATANYTATSITAILQIIRNPNNLTSFVIPVKQFGNAPFTLSNPATSSSGAFTYTSSDTTVATISGNVVTILGIGNSTITAVQAMTPTYEAGTITGTLVVNVGTSVLTNFSVPAKTFGDASFNLVAPTANGNGAITYTSSNTAVATVTNNTVTIVGVGTSTITASQASTTNYTSATTTATLTVSKATTALTNFAVGTKIFGDASFNLVAPTTNSNGVITYTSSNTAVATVSGTTITIVSAGTSTITASQATNTNFLAATTTSTLTVNKATPTITNFSEITKTFGNAAFSLVAPTTNSTGAFTYTSSNTAVATIAGSTATIVGGGTVTITATQATTTNYLAGTITTPLTVNKATPTITNFSEITKTFGNADFTLVAPTSNSAGSFTYTSSNTAVATITGSTVTIVGGGTATITASQATTTNYLAGTTTAAMTVSQATPMITIFDVPAKAIGAAPFSLVAPTSNSSGAFTYTSSNTSVATMDGSMVTIVGLGNTTITAVQASTTNYLSGSITGIFAIMTNVPLSIAVGSGGNSIATSVDRGLTWTGRGTSVFTNSGRCIAFGKDGSGNNLLVAVGSGGNTIATSTNGTTWIGRGVSVFTSQGLGVTYANNLWVAVGQGTNSIATSLDGVVWTGRTGTSIFSNQGHGVAFNNGLWVAVGDGTNSIATSPDGVVWTGRGKTNLSGWGRGIAYGNGLWVAVGQGTNSIATSPDGVVWTGRTGTSIFSNQGICVAFNNGLWVAVGDGTTTTIATSTDGVNWTSRGKTTFSVLGHSVAFNSGLWIAAGQGTNSIATSPDGTTWTGRGTSIFSTSGFGVAVGIITPPVISSISPSAGAIVGGTSVTITGTNFTGATSVTFDGLNATTINVVNSTTITCITPARSAGAAGIIVTTEDGPSGEFSSFTYITPPSITGISPSSGSTEGGTSVTITGTSFIGATSVTFGGIAATTINVVNSTTITCITPARSIGAVGIIVTTLYGTSGAFSSFTYITPPVISSISPLTGSTLEETNVTIRGTNFTGATLVTFGGLSATSLSIVNSTTITCITPVRSAGAVDIIVTTGGGPSGAFSSFTYIIPPNITDISPSSGSTLGGTTVTITGTNFTGATSVTFGGLAATAINVVNSTTITCITRDRTAGAGAVGIIVTTGGGPSGAFSSFNYITPPVISSILPLTGSTLGGTSVTITGTSFTEATLVTFSGLPATSLSVVNSTTITCITPVRSTGAAGIIVKTLYGTSVAFSSFTYITPPNITGISPSSGGIAGGTNVTITGKNFTGATLVTFGGLSATSLSVVNSTTITCITPVRSAGAAGIIVTTGGGPSGAFSSFTYITPPIITSISQLTGSTEGGTSVTITGTHFTGATSVTFDGIAATTINVVNSTTITCITPARTTVGAVGIIVTTAGGPSVDFSSFTYITPPNITDISSSFGSTLGGTNVTITGTNFTGATLVTFGGLAATTINVANSTTITCITPARTTAGAVGIIVTTGGGPSGAFSSFTYITPPNITSISQLTGSTAGGTNVTITGTNFTGATSVTFDGLAATSINVVNSTTITCITPARSAGAVDIIVTTGGGSSGAFSSFTYITSSVISSISPSSGGIAGGTSVTITGINFTGATSVTFDGIAATTINVLNSTTITCITPAHSDGAVNFIVTTGGGPSDAFSSFTYIIPPSITDISPSSGINTGGTSVTITGTNFTGATLVTFGGIAATTINVVNSTTISCITPAVSSDGAVGIIVTSGGGPSGAFSSFTYITSSAISSISPSSGGIAGETSVTITGINFTGATSVTFDGIAATTINVVNSTTITCITPARTTAGAVGIIVTTGGGPSGEFSSFTYITPPNITGILSSSGSTEGGTNVTITGTNFTGATSVTFDGLAATTINVVNSTTITCITPAHSAGAVGIIVTTQGGSSGAFSSFTYITPPNITDISSSFGSTLGGTNVTITGTNFTGATSVTFDDLAATTINVVNSTTITCITPARTTAGAVGIIVTTQGGPSGAFSEFTYITPPNITSISQLTGSTAGGTNVTITGTNFTGATLVTFGGLAATSIDVANSTTITCITPAHSAGAVNVIVTTGGGPSGAFSSFTYITPPNITSISQLTGSTAGGTSIIITGTSFTGETSVTFDGLAATTINVVNSTTITCITPARATAGAVDIIVTTEGRTSGAFSSFTYITPPNITGISPSSGSTLGGTNATITGTNFTGATSVTFDGLAATTINVVNSTTITCITPAHITGVVGIIVTTGGGPSTIFASSFTYNTPPNISGISPSFGSTAGGTSVTITGTSFTGATLVTFGGVAATTINVVNSTTITCITPARATAGAVGVVVTTQGGPSNTFASFTYILPPNIKSMLPLSVSRVGGTSVTITGTNFIGATSVTLGGLNATSFNVVSNTSITCITPERTTGGTVGVIVTTGGGPSNTLSTFIYTPFVSAILPAFGTRSGGTSVKITGIAFTGATSVTFGGIAATNVLIFNATTITCKTPATNTAGAAGIVVTTRDGPSNTFSPFTYLTPPNITSISPSYGGTSGGTTVIITGQSFTGVSIIKFGDLKVKSLRVIDDTTITCVTAARTTPGPVDITVQNSIGISNAFSSFTYITTPKITSISPNFGSTTGGNTVTITGTDLTGATEVMVGDLSCATINVVNSTTMTCITPARVAAGPVSIIVTTGGGPTKKSSPFTYIMPPIIASISPSQGGTTGGNVVTITGLNFKGVTSVTFGGLNALLVKAVNPTTITCKTPVSLDAGAVDVIVTTGGGPSNTFSSFTYIIPPVISAISPAAGNKAGGNSVTITGTNFTGATSVTFGKTVTTNITVVDDTTITCITPLNPAGVFGVIVRTGGGPSNIFASFTFVTPATISSILPVSGSTTGGTSVTIKGKTFTGATSVTFGGLDATSLTVVNDTLITCIAPARIEPGGVGIIVTTAGGPSTQFSFYNYITPPVITSISPSSGSMAGGNVVTITGTSFEGARSVTFNGITATTIVVVNSTTITCKTPLSTSAGTGNIIVTTGGGPSNTFTGFTYVTPAVITSISPSSGTKAGGTSVTITGTNFTGASVVSFGAKVATNIIVVNDTTLTCVTPLSTPIAVGIIITTAGGLSNKFSSFTYS